MNKLLIVGAMSLSWLNLGAKEWTLQECVDYAVANNLTVLQRSNDVLQAENDLTSAKDAVLPTVSGQGQQSWNFGRGLTASNTYADRNTSNFGLSLGLNLPLFQGLQTYRQIQYQRTYLSSMVESLESAKDDITLQVMAQYLQVLYSQEMEEIARSQVKITSDELERRKALLEVGKIPEADMLDAKAQDAQAKVQLVTAQNDTRLALLDLSQLLRLESVEGFNVAKPDDEMPELRDPREVYDRAMGSNHSVLAGRLQVEAAGQQISVAKTGWIPRLNLSAGLGSNYYKVNGLENERFSDQFRHNFAQQIGLSLSVPIFDAFQTRNAVRRARVNQVSTQLNFETAADNLYKAIQQAYYQAAGARERHNAATLAVEASEASLNAVTEKYGLGRATPTEFENAKNQYVKALSERTQAKFEFLLRARILAFYGK
ncbi:MAG: TolC family protein [Muribaculaceae bacterium]|nr:TolC family protein [Muribaculaceae bacterium]